MINPEWIFIVALDLSSLMLEGGYMNALTQELVELLTLETDWKNIFSRQQSKFGLETGIRWAGS